MPDLWHRDIKPKDIPVVKVDPFYQMDRDHLGLTQTLLIHPFLTTESGAIQHRIGGAWAYMDILTDGAFNPFNNYHPPATDNSRCYIEFDDHEVVYLNREVYNLPIHQKQHFRLYNEKHPSQSAVEYHETGYNSIFFIVKKFPSEVRMKKHNPVFCVYHTAEPDTITTFWYGSDAVAGVDNLIVPWLPIGYRFIHACLSIDGAGAGNTTIVNFEYSPWPYCTPRDQPNCTGGTYTQCYEYRVCTNRGYFRVMNTDAQEQSIVKFHGYWIQKSDNR